MSQLFTSEELKAIVQDFNISYLDSLSRSCHPDDMWRHPVSTGIVREQMRDSVLAYIQEGRPVGDFLTAVLSNDLREAVGRADNQNLSALPSFVFFLYNYAPSGCWGNRPRVQRWIDSHSAARRLEEITQGESYDANR